MAFHFEIFKEPRGLIRLLQFIIAIFAFATACSGDSYLTIDKGSNSSSIKVAWEYPYNLQDTQIETKLNKSRDTVSTSNDIKPSAEFFVFTGVTSMLLALGFCIVYVIMDREYRNNERIPIPTVDLIITIIWTIFWIAGSSAWAQGVSNIRSQTSFDAISSIVYDCSGGSCVVNESGTYANVIVSVIFGFLNFFLWASSVWFVYKETKFFRSRTAQQQLPPQTFSNISGSSMQQQSQSRIPGSMG